MTKHTILFLAANPLGTDGLVLDQEARAIQVELERSGHRHQFELMTRWAAQPLDLLRELRKLKPTVVHFSGHGGRGRPGAAGSRAGSQRDVVGESGEVDGDHQQGLFFLGPDGRAQLVSTAALQETFGAAGASVKLVVLGACYSESQAQALLAHVDCVVGMRGAISDDAARSFAIGFYGGLGEHESVAAAFQQGCAAMSLEGQADCDRPKLTVRRGVDAARLVLAAAFASHGDHAAPTSAGQRTGSNKAANPATVDIGILVIRDDEFPPLKRGAIASRLGIILVVVIGVVAVFTLIFVASIAEPERVAPIAEMAQSRLTSITGGLALVSVLAILALRIWRINTNQHEQRIESILYDERARSVKQAVRHHHLNDVGIRDDDIRKLAHQGLISRERHLRSILRYSLTALVVLVLFGTYAAWRLAHPVLDEITIAGIVLDERSRSVEGASITVESRDFWVESNEDGTFQGRLTRITPGEILSIHISKKGFLRTVRTVTIHSNVVNMSQVKLIDNAN